MGAARHDGKRIGRQVLRTAVAVSLLAATVAAGCAKRHAYPGDRLPDDQVAYIRSDRQAFANVEVTIDGKAVGPLDQYYIPPAVGDGFLGRPTTGVSVLPGVHDMNVRVAVLGWTRAAWTKCARLSFTSQAGASYKMLFVERDVVLKDMKTGDILTRSPLATCPAAHARNPA